MTRQCSDDVSLEENTSPDIPAGESMRAGLSELAALAREAFEEKRSKSCLALTGAILKIDPQNNDAEVMQARVQSDLQHDIKQAYESIRDAHIMIDPSAYQRARLLLQNVLDVNPSNEDAKILLLRVDSALRSGAPASSDSAGVASVSQHQGAAPVPREPTGPLDPAESLEPGVHERSLRLLVYAILIASVASLGVAIAFVFASKLEWGKRSDVDSPAIVSASRPAASTGSDEFPADEGSRVLLDGQDAGTAPIAGPKPKTGDFSGADAGQQTVTVPKDEVATNSMNPSFGRIELLILPSNAEMQIDDRPAVSLPPYLDLEAGKHRLTFTASGYEPQTVSVSVAAGGRRNVAAVLVPAIPPVPVYRKSR